MYRRGLVLCARTRRVWTLPDRDGGPAGNTPGVEIYGHLPLPGLWPRVSTNGAALGVVELPGLRQDADGRNVLVPASSNPEFRHQPLHAVDVAQHRGNRGARDDDAAVDVAVVTVGAALCQDGGIEVGADHLACRVDRR